MTLQYWAGKWNDVAAPLDNNDINSKPLLSQEDAPNTNISYNNENIFGKPTIYDYPSSKDPLWNVEVASVDNTLA